MQPKLHLPLLPHSAQLINASARLVLKLNWAVPWQKAQRMSGLCAGPTNEAIGGVSFLLLIAVERLASVTLFCPLLNRGLVLLVSADAVRLLMLPFALVPIRVEDRLVEAGASFIISSTVCMKSISGQHQVVVKKKANLHCLSAHTGLCLRLPPPPSAQLITQLFTEKDAYTRFCPRLLQRRWKDDSHFHRSRH